MENKDSIVIFKTGGTTANSKVVRKSAANFEKESRDICEALKLEGDLEFITTTTIEHLFGYSFHYSLPRVCGFRRNENRVNYPEDINVENAVLVTTPSFLEVMRKYDVKPPVNPKVIIAAGAKLEDETFKYAMSISDKVVEIYGSTETGVIGYRTSYETKRLKLFRGIKVLETTDDFTKIETEYSLVSPVMIEDRIKSFGDEIEFVARAGRVLKIQEKRVMSDEIETEIKKFEYIEDVYCFEYEGKLAALAVLSEVGKKFLLENDKLTLVKKLKSGLLSEGVVPQHWKFFDEIPKKKNGKVDKEFIHEIFSLNLSMPLILSRFVEGEQAFFKLAFIKNSSFFKGHFEEFPILPGVAQLFFANWFTKLAYGIDCSAGQIRKVKFSNIIKPDEIIELELKKTEKGVVYKYLRGEVLCSSGVLPEVNNL